MDSVFYYILNMSIASVFIITAIFLIRLIKPLSKRIIYPLWILVFLRLVFPFALTTRWSLFNFTGKLVKRLITPVSGIEELAFMNVIGAAQNYSPVIYKTESLRKIFTTGSMIWLIIASAAILAAFFLYLLTMIELRKATPVRDNIYSSQMLLTPVVAGLIRPRIILPPGLHPDSSEGKMVLAHEEVHIKRLDNLWRIMALATACIHWFNPFVWLMVKAFFTDMELSCDERVMTEGKFGVADRKAYASALLRFSEEKKMVVSTAFGQAGVKVRIVNVLNYKRITIIGAAISALFITLVALILITNPG